MIITTGNEIAGRNIVEYLGIAVGVVVRVPTIGQGFSGAVQSVFGGNVPAYVAVCETARREAYEKMLANARGLGADAVIAMRYDATEFAANATEVLAYGTAVRLDSATGLSDREAMVFLDPPNKG